MSSNDPREIWLLTEAHTNRAIVAHVGETRTWAGVHYIEYSAYESMRDKYNHAHANEEGNKRLYLSAVQERDELQVKLNERTAVMQDSGDIVRSLFQGSEVSKRILKLTEERDEARAELKKFVKFDAFLKDDGDVSPEVYESAVKGRQDFRNALKAERANSAIKEKNKQRCHRMYRELEAKSQKLVEALEVIASREISKHVAHPQSVWWSEWVMEPLREILAEYSAATPTESTHDYPSFMDFYQTWIDANGSRSPSIRIAMSWMFDKLRSRQESKKESK